MKSLYQGIISSASFNIRKCQELYKMEGIDFSHMKHGHYIASGIEKLRSYTWA